MEGRGEVLGEGRREGRVGKGGGGGERDGGEREEGRGKREWVKRFT